MENRADSLPSLVHQASKPGPRSDLPQLARLSFVHQVIRLEFFENRSGSFNFHFNFRNEVQSLIGQVILLIYLKFIIHVNNEIWILIQFGY